MDSEIPSEQVVTAATNVGDCLGYLPTCTPGITETTLIKQNVLFGIYFWYLITMTFVIYSIVS